jgi:carbon storage regulator
MLVITRREGEEVIIGDPSAPLGIVRIAAIKGDRVRIAFEFPREVPVHRREVAEQITAAEKEGNPIVGQIRPAAGGENA